MTPETIPQLLHHVTRIGVALVFVGAGVLKLSNMPEFASRLGDFGIVHDALVVPVAWAIVLAELLLGVALALNLRGSLAGVLLLLGLFVGVLLYGIMLGLDVECGCFGPGYGVSLQAQLAVDAGLVVLCGIVYWSRRKGRIQTVDPIARILELVRRGNATT